MTRGEWLTLAAFSPVIIGVLGILIREAYLWCDRWLDEWMQNDEDDQDVFGDQS